jgi:hypothetical protein
MLKPGDKIDTMILTRGAEQVVPLWAFCLPAVKSDHLITADCHEVSFAALAIGHTFGVKELLPQPVDGSELTWELELDGHPIELGAFGTCDFVQPDLTLSPSPVREIFRTVTVWDVVLENPTAGGHRLRGLVRSAAETFTWLVDFSVRALPGN